MCKAPYNSWATILAFHKLCWRKTSITPVWHLWKLELLQMWSDWWQANEQSCTCQCSVRTGSLHLLPSLGRKKWAIDLIKSSLSNRSVLVRYFWEVKGVFILTSLQVLVSPWAQWVALLGWMCAPSMEWSHLWLCLCRTVLSALTLMLFFPRNVFTLF